MIKTVKRDAAAVFLVYTRRWKGYHLLTKGIYERGSFHVKIVNILKRVTRDWTLG